MSPDQTIPIQTTPPTTPEPTDPYARPHWAAVHEEIACPLCGYNLRGLDEPMCPECGYRFDWPDLLDPTRRRHPWLFEHHPKHNVWSFCKTIVRNFRRGRFWKELHPSQPSRPRRLVIYWIIGAIVSMIPFLLVIAYRLMQWLPSTFATTRWAGRPLSFFDALWHDDITRVMLLLCVIAVLFPWFNLLALLVFQQSMGRAKVMPHHVMRCAIYSSDVIVWLGLLGGAATAYWLWQSSSWRGDERLVESFLLLFVGAGLLNFLRLISAYRHYLKFEHVYLTIIAAQVVVLLACFTLFMQVVEFVF